MAPVVDIDDGALAGDAQESGVDHVVGRLPGRAHKHETEPLDGGDQRQAEIGEAAQPPDIKVLRKVLCGSSLK